MPIQRAVVAVCMAVHVLAGAAGVSGDDGPSPPGSDTNRLCTLTDLMPSPGETLSVPPLPTYCSIHDPTAVPRRVALATRVWDGRVHGV